MKEIIKKIRNFKLGLRNGQKGMTYVELIVVLSIFAIMSSIVMFNYREFQARVEIKRLVNDIGLKFVEAQKSAMSGKGAVNFTGKPSYGLYFNLNGNFNGGTNNGNKNFIYFADIDGFKTYDTLTASCDPDLTTECIKNIEITKDNFIESIQIDIGNGLDSYSNGVHLSFTRPDSGLNFYNDTAEILGAKKVVIAVSSPENAGNYKGYITIYASGRIEVK